MNEAAPIAITVEQFLAYEGEPDTRYELIDGKIAAMNPPSDRHGLMRSNLIVQIERRLEERPPCRTRGEAGIRISDHNYFVADIAVSRTPTSGEPFINQPRLIVEILSPSTTQRDRGTKLPASCTLPTVEEVWLVDSTRHHVQTWTRQKEGWLVRDYVGLGTFASTYLNDDIDIAKLYRNVDLTEPAEEE